MSTLLEPSNRVIAWAGGEEKKEIATVLGTLRKKHDYIKKLANAKAAEIREKKVRKR